MAGAAASATAQQLQQLNMIATTKQLLAEGGLMRLFRGVSINYLKVVPSTAIGFTLYDAVKAYLDLTSNL
jgi:solute carrier family 25 protein 16